MTQKYRIRLEDGTGAVSKWYDEQEFGVFLSRFLAARCRAGKTYRETPPFRIQLDNPNDPLL